MESREQTQEKIEKYWSFWVWFFDMTSYVEHRKLPGWTGYLPFYRFDCPKHGRVINYPQGYKQILYCPRCVEEHNEL